MRRAVSAVRRFDASTVSEAAVERFRATQTLPERPEVLWLVRSGLVQVNKLLPDGEEALLALVGPKTAIGPGLFRREGWLAKALVDVEVQCFDWEQLQRATRVPMEVNQGLTRLLLQMEAVVTLQQMRGANQRLGALLALLAEQCGQPSPQGLRLPLRLTHAWLASLIGCQRGTVTRYLGELQAASLLRVGEDRCLCVHPDLLKQVD